LDAKQDELTAGNNITIVDNVISTSVDQGPQGEQGIQGPTGPTGADGALWDTTLVDSQIEELTLEALTRLL